MGDLVIVSKLADLENVPYYGELKLSSGTTNPIEEKNSCVLTGYDITIQAHDYPAIRCYNSAVYKSTNDQVFYIFCPLSEPNYLMIWKTGSIFSYSRYNNVQYENVYLDTLNYGLITADGATFPYFNYSLDYRNVGGENNVKWIDSLPVFDNLQNFVDYVTAPLEPQGDATCKVTYFLPDDTYEYTKLTYKKSVQPESVNDGTIVNLDPTQDSVTVEGLIENTSYWFKIFTNKSESEAFPYTVEPAKSKIITVWDYQNNIKTNVLRNGETEQSFYLWSDNYLYCYRDTSRYGLYVSNNIARVKITKGYSDTSIAPYSNNIAVLRMTIKVDSLKSQGAHYLGISVNAVGTKRSGGNYDAIMGCNCIQGDDYSKYVVGETFTWEGYWDIQYWIDNNIPFLTDGFKIYIDSGVKDTITFRVYKIEIECCEGEILG